MLDNLIAFGAIFDWITPLFTWLQDAAQAPSVGYNISVHAGWSALAIEKMLRSHGVKTWGLSIFDETITFRVREAQAEYAQYLLDARGIPFVGGVDITHSDTSVQQKAQTIGTIRALDVAIEPLSRMTASAADKIADKVSFI